MASDEDGERRSASPFSRLMHTTNFNLSIIVVMGFSTPLDVGFVKHVAAQTVLKHPRFSSILVMEEEKRLKMSWKPTKPNIDEHVLVPDLDEEIEVGHGDKFVDDFISTIGHIPMDLSKPLWELHLLNVKTTHSISTVVFKVHHSVGDGVSLMSIVLACGRKISDPEALPVLPTNVQRRSRKSSSNNKGICLFVAMLIWRMLLIVYYTIMDAMEFVATITFLKDSQTPIKAGSMKMGHSTSPRKYVHRILNFDDVKLIKNSLKTTVNDVFMGITEAALASYLDRRRYASEKVGNEENGAKFMKKTSNPFKKLRIRAATPFNLRPSPTVQDTYEVIEKEKKMEDMKMWGNIVSFITVPMKLCTKEDPLSYVRDAKAMMNRKKLSLFTHIEYFSMKLIIYLFGVNAAAHMMSTYTSNITFGISSVIGPMDEINFLGHPLTYLAPTVTGIPLSLVIHFQTYAKKLIVFLAIDETVIPDHHQLCDDFQNSLQIIKEAVMKNITTNNNNNGDDDAKNATSKHIVSKTNGN